MSAFPDKHITVGGDDPFLPSLLAAINHATEIAITTAFIRMTGVRLIQGALEDALLRKAKVRILTGDYLGITDPSALRYFMLLQEQGAEVKVFQSDGKTSFHMKAYLFVRCNDDVVEEGCVFVGSSNISQAALQGGLEWNIRVGRDEDQARFQSILDEYEQLYSGARCRPLTHKWIDDYVKRLPPAGAVPSTEPGQEEVEPPPTPNPIQEKALKALYQSREKGYRRGLVVMATGLGKTWLAAFDSQQVNAKRVLFVAHRKEILNQAEETFVRIRPDAKVGRYAGKDRELNVDMLFASVLTLGRSHHLQVFSRDYFDYIVVDEFHHASARTYQQLLAHFSPRFLLGLTATPERTDQSDILALCDDNLVFNRDLFDGIEAKLLCPFTYHGIADVVDYQEIKWRAGTFEPAALLSQLATRGRAKHNFSQWQQYRQSRTLAFCISQKHADFMAEYFRAKGVSAISVHSESAVRRNEALKGLAKGEVEVVFSVDLFNEGVDLPAIDTVLMLRPTESKIIFLQQLGRGLRNSPNKERLVVLDFIGNHESFFRKPEALFKVGVTNQAHKQFIEQVKTEILPLPSGCFVNYDLQAIDFMEKLTATRVDIQEDIYQSLYIALGHRPTMTEFYNAGGNIDTIRREHGQWHTFVDSQSHLSEIEKQCLAVHKDFFLELEVTALTKSFKLVLIEALLELDGFNNVPSTAVLAEKSFEVFHRRRVLQVDLPEDYRRLEVLSDSASKRWHSYWSSNPINAWIGGNRQGGNDYFFVQDGNFSYTLGIENMQLDSFMLLVQEVVNYRFLRYEVRLANKGIAPSIAIAADSSSQLTQIPFFSDLKIACGHFKTSTHETKNIESRGLPPSYGSLSPSRHFLAKAKGSSMDGGKNAIADGDFLLLEVITPESAGSISSQVVAVERQEVTGDDQYLLRYVKKIPKGGYQLEAFNSEYGVLDATEEMRTFARLKSVVDPVDMLLHQQVLKHGAPQWFGLEYIEGLWKMPGHVCPRDTNDQFFFVTLNKQNADKDYKYHDYFVNQAHFHWQSQNKTTPDNAKGLRVIHHEAEGSDIHLFVRKHAKIKGKGAPFYYCGRLTYKSHTGAAPMDVDFSLQIPLPNELIELFSG